MANTIKIRRSAVQGASPTTSQIALGELAVNTYDGKLFLKKSTSGNETGAGTSIVEIGAGGGGSGTYTVSATAPSSPAAGDRWLETDLGIEYVYVNDGNSSAWVETGAPGVGATGATGTAATIAVGTTTTGAAGSSATVTNSGTSSAATFNFTIPRGDTGATGATGPMGPKSITILNPTASEKICLFFTTTALTLSQIRSVIVGGTSVDFRVNYGTDFSAAGTQTTTNAIVANSTTTGVSTTSFSSASIAADRFVWLTTSAVSGSVTQLQVTLIFS